MLLPFALKDITKPTAMCPVDVKANATDESGTTATVSFLVSCLDGIDKNIQPVCNATKNVTSFSVGETTVICSCEDNSRNTDQCAFKVSVKGLLSSSH